MAKGETFNGLPGWAKGIIAVAVVTGIIYGGHLILKEIKKSKDQKGSKEEDEANKDELKTLNADPKKKQTLSPAMALSVANALHAAMDGTGTDGSAITKNLLQLKNQADWLAVSAAYKIRTIKSIVGDFTGTLLSSLTSELGVTDTHYVTVINKAFQQRGITVRV